MFRWLFYRLLNRWGASNVAPSPGGLVCGTVSMAARVSGTVTILPRVSGTASIEEC